MMLSSLEYSEPSAINVKEQHAAQQTEWKRIVTDLTSLGGTIGSPPSSPLSISWSSSASSIDNETCVPPKPFTHHHVVTKLNFDSCVPQNTISPHHIRAKVSRVVINCASNSLEESCKPCHDHIEQSKADIVSQDPICSIPQDYKDPQENVKQHKSQNAVYIASQDFFCSTSHEESCKLSSEHVEQNKTQNLAQIISQDVVCSVNSNEIHSINVQQLDKESIDFQCNAEENDLVVCSPTKSFQLSPVIVRSKPAHCASCKNRCSSESNICVCKTRALSQELSKSPLLGTSIKKKPLKTSNICKQSREIMSPRNQADRNSCPLSDSPVLQHKRRRKLNFENSFRKNREKCPSEHCATNLNLPIDYSSVENHGELTANLHLQVSLEHVSSINQNCPAESLITERQVDKPTSPVLLPVNSKTKKRKCKRKIQQCKALRECTNSENAEQVSSHFNQGVICKEQNSIPKMVFQTPDKEIKERNVLRDISGSYAFSPSNKEIRPAISVKKTSEKLKLKENTNRGISFETMDKFPRKHVKRKIMHVEGIKALVPENYSFVNYNIHDMVILNQEAISQELFSSTAVDATNGNEPNSSILTKNRPYLVLEENIPLENDAVDKSNFIDVGQIHQDDQKTGEDCTCIGGVTESNRGGGIKTPTKAENSLYNSSSLVLNESTNLPKQNHIPATGKVNSVEKRHIIHPFTPNKCPDEQQCIAHDNIVVSPTFRTTRSLSKIKEKKIKRKHDKLSHFEVKDCIMQQVNTPKPYKLTDLEEELIKFSFAKAPVSTLAITSATRYKERLKWLREQKSKTIDQSCLIEHETQGNVAEEVVVPTTCHSNINLKNEANVLDTFKETNPLNKVEAKLGVHVLEANKSGKNIAVETNGQEQEESPLNPDSSELCIENESSQEVTSVKIEIYDKKEEEHIPSQQISEKSSSSTNASPVALHDISNCTTPTKTSTSASGEEMVPYCDSAKKKRRPRFNKDGLAARLQKLLLRQHSSTRIWQHELSRGNAHWRKTSVTLTVTSIKREYSHLLLQGMLYTSNASEEKKIDESMVSAQLIVVLDPACAPQLLKVGSRIKIYPPWQTLSITMFDLTLVLGVTCVEELPFQEKTKSIPLKPRSEELVYAANCSCLNQEPSAQRKCQFHFPLGGIEIFSHLLPHAEYVKGPLLCSTKSEPQPWHGTITDIVTRHGCLLTGSVWLQLRISRVFHYIDRASKKDIWSLLGRDNIGECCEIILGPSPTEMDVLNCWTDITTQHIIGHLHRFTGFMLTDRKHKSRHQALWTVLKAVQVQHNEVTRKCNSENENSSTAAEEETEKELNNQTGVNVPKSADSTAKCNNQTGEENSQLFFYVLSPCADNWQMKCVTEEILSEWPKLHRSSLYDLLQQRDDGLSRHSCLVKVLYTTTENLYVADTSLGQGTVPAYVIVAVKPSCFLPADAMKKRAKAVFLQDLLYDQGKLCVDKYSWVISLEDIGTKIRWLDYEESLKSEIEKLNITIPRLDLTSSINHLVTVTGAVIGVDEETAFAWPVCAMCENELLLEISPNKYVCQHCKKQVETYQKMSLEIFISCTWLPLSSSIKVKLLQQSILKLLPSTENNNEGYSLIAVLGQEVGPLICLVISAKNHNFVLEEINIS